jgi:hypothetical protein
LFHTSFLPDFTHVNVLPWNFTFWLRILHEVPGVIFWTAKDGLRGLTTKTVIKSKVQDLSMILTSKG